MALHLRDFVLADKSIPSSLAWVPIGRNYLSWISPLDIDSVTVAGLQLHVGANLTLPDEAVRAQLEYHPPKGKSEQLVRVEWRPLADHNNKGRGPSEHRFKPFRQTHTHPFEMNWDEAKQRMRSGNLPIAISIQDVDSYEKFLDLCAAELRINNMSVVPLPPWHPRMI